MRHILEIKKAENLMSNFETLPASDIKNIVPFLMNAMNFYLKSEGYSGIDEDFFVINGIKKKRELFDLYFFLKNLKHKDFMKTDRNSIIIKSWKSNVYLKKEYFNMILKRAKDIVMK